MVYARNEQFFDLLEFKLVEIYIDVIERVFGDFESYANEIYEYLNKE